MATTPASFVSDTPASFQVDAPTQPPASAPPSSTIGPTPKASDMPTFGYEWMPPEERMTMPLAKVLMAAHDKLKEVENFTQEGKREHPIQAKMGEVANNIAGFLFGNEEHRESAIGTGKTGILTNPVTAALVPGAEGEPALAEGIRGGVNLVKAAAKGAGKLIPSAARAGEALEDVTAVAGKVPIDMSKPGNTALKIWEESEHGASLPPVVRKFVQRATKPGSDPITYAEAKQFQSNVSQLSAEERMALKPNTKRLLGQLNADLKDSLEGAADTVGKGQKFADAMKEYHDAMTLQGMTKAAKEVAWKAAIAGTLGALGYKAFKLLE